MPANNPAWPPPPRPPNMGCRSDLEPGAVVEWLQATHKVWCASGNFYALDLTEALGVETSGGLVRSSLC